MTTLKRCLLFLVAAFVTVNTGVANAKGVDADYIYLAAARGNVDYLNTLSKDKGAIEITNSDGDTPLCIAARKKNKVAYRTLISAGANKNAACLKSIEGESAFAAEAMTTPITKQDNSIFAAIVPSSTMGWVGAAAVVGGVAALAGGGGGGGGSGGCRKFLGDDGVCYEIVECVNGSQYRDYCVCNEGWEGELCDAPVVCASDYVGIGECPLGYYNNKNSNSCHSGNSVLYKCVQHTDPNCKSGSPIKDECMVCNSGYEVNGSGLCVERNCGSDYRELGECDLGMWNDETKDSCQSADKMLYKCYAHKVVDKCSSYDDVSDVCISCEYGYVLKGGKCEINECKSSYASLDGCSEGYWQNKTDECKQGEEYKYLCVARSNTQGCVTYDPYSDTCLSCDGAGYNLVDGRCEVNVCDGSYAAYGECQRGWNETTEATLCLEGKNQKYKCQEHTAPANLCETYDKKADKCSKCFTGYEPSGNQCVPYNCGDSYADLGECGNLYYNNKTTTPCQSGDEVLYECVKISDTKCVTNNPLKNECITCTTGYVPNASGVCEVKRCEGDYAKLGECGAGKYNINTNQSCQSGEDVLYLCLVNDVENCTTPSKTSNTCETCKNGYTLENGLCVETDCGDNYAKVGECGVGKWNNNTQNMCLSGTTSEYECKAYTVANCSVYHELYDKCTTCNEGYSVDANGQCVPAACEGYAALSACSTGWNNNQQTTCKSGEDILYKCQAHTVENCQDKAKDANKCTSCKSVGYDLTEEGACVVHNCGSDFAISGACTTGYNSTSTTKCVEGSTNKYKCLPHTEVDNCVEYSKSSDKCQTCEEGWSVSSGKCIVSACSGYANVGACSTGWNDEAQKQCKSGKNVLYQCKSHTKVDRCVTYNPRANECVLCTVGYKGAQCNECDNGYKADANGVCYPDLNCQHGTTQDGDKCDCGSTGFTGDECSVCESGQVEGDYCYPKLDCQYGGTQNKDSCQCLSGFNGTFCQTCPSGDIIIENGVYVCKESLGCQHGGTQENGACVCVEGSNWTGDKCQTCPSGDSLGDTCFEKRTDCSLQHSNGQKYGECQCTDGWSGETCDTCDGVVSAEGMCIPTYAACGEHGVWSNIDNKCECDDGYTGDRCENAPAIVLNCKHGSSPSADGTKCVCTGNWTGTECGSCASGDYEGDICYPKINCYNYGKQKKGVCECNFSNWTGANCNECPSGYEVREVSGVSLCLSPEENERGCMFGDVEGNSCICYNGWSGEHCDECVFDGVPGVTKGNVCYEKMECNHGTQDGGRCVCEEGWKGTLCNEQTTPNNYNFSKNITVTKDDATTGQTVAGLEHDGSSSNKIGTWNNLYNAYVKDGGTINDTYEISVTNTNPANSSNTFGMKNDSGNAYAAYVKGNNTISGTLNSVINVTHETTEENKSASYSMFGIHAEKDVITIKKEGSNANNLDVSSVINVTYRDTYTGTYETDTGVKVELYGIHSRSGNVHNTANSTINVTSEVSRGSYKPHTYLYGAYSRKGNATNDGIINLTGATDGPVYGLYAALKAINTNGINISGDAAAYGIFAIQEVSSSGNVSVVVNKKGDVYGIRTPGSVTLSGTLSATTASGAAYGVHAGGAITNTNSTTTVSGTSAYGLKSDSGNITSTGGSISVTSKTGIASGIQTNKAVTNTSNITISAGGSASSVFGINAGEDVSNKNNEIKITASNNYDSRYTYGISTKGNVTNTGTINVSTSSYGGATYGISTTGAIDNTGGTISVKDTYYANVYGVYTTSGIDVSKLGTISASSSSSDKAVAVYFGTGDIELNDTNTATLSASSSYERYLFEGSSSTSIMNSATISAGLKAGTVTNSGSLSGARYGIYAYNTATNTGTVNASSSSSSSYGTRGIYASGAISNVGGTVNVSGYSGYYDTSYGIISDKGSIDNTNGMVTANGGEVYGIYTTTESVNNTNGSVNINSSYSSNSYTTYSGGIKTTTGDVNNSFGNVSATSKNTYLYGISTSNGDINNSDGSVMATATHKNSTYTYGINTSTGEVDNRRGTVYASGLNTVYGIKSGGGSINNTKGTIEVEIVEESTGTAYGIYTSGAIDSNALGTIKVSSENGKAVGIHFGKGEIELTNTNTRDISVTGNERLLFEGGAGTTVKNSAIISAGIKAENVENTGTISGGKYGIYAEKTVKNSGTVSAQADTVAYGIYTNGTLDLSGLTGSVSATADEKAVGVYFGEGEVEINSAAAGKITVNGGGELYVVEGAEGTTVTNNAQFNNGGIKAGTVNNNGALSAAGKYGIYAYNDVVNTATITSDEYGIYADGSVTNSGNITTTNSNKKAYGIRADSIVNSKKVTVTSTNNVAYGLYGLNTVENTGGTLTVKSNSSDAYGIYTNGGIDLSKIGTISVSAGSTGTAVGVRFANDTVSLTGNHGISISSGLERYLFEGGKNTTINNSASISAGLKAETVSNTGTITSAGIRGVYASSAVTNSGTIKATATYNDVYGVYLDNTNATLDNTNGNVEVTNSSTSTSTAYGVFTKGAIDVTKLGTIKVTANTSNGKAIGVHFEDGTLTLNNNLDRFTLTGKEKYLVNGGVETTIINNANLTNGGLSTEQGSIVNNVSIATTSNTGIYAKTGTVVNSGDISVSGSGTLYGIRATEGSVVTNSSSGSILVTKSGSSSTAYGVYLNASNFDNQGTIEVKNTYNTSYSNMYGIYATNGSNVVNSGIIKITSTSGTKECTSENCTASTSSPTSSTPVFVYTSSDSTFANGGAVMSSLALDLNSAFGDGQVLLDKNGSFVAPELSGSLGVSANVVEEGFENTYTLQDAIVADDTTDLNLASGSALFDASLDGQDVVMTRKNFTDVVENNSMAQFLENNYKFENNAELFETLKQQNNAAMLNSVVDTLSGAGLKRFNFEDMAMLKEVSADMSNKLFDNDNEYFTLTGNTHTSYFEENSSANSRWMISGKKQGSKSFGVGIAFGNINSYDGDSNNNRKDESVQVMMPFGYNVRNFELIAMPRLGYSYGTYNRDGINNMNYDGTIEKRIFGLNTAVRYPVEVNSWKLSPTVEFNAINYLMDGSEENKPYALNIDKQNVLSAEVGMGLNVSKAYTIDQTQNMKVNFGLMAYHEFMDPYELKLSMKGMDGSWRIRDERRKDNHITVNGGFEYKVAPFAIYGNVFSYIDSEYNTKADFGFKFDF